MKSEIYQPTVENFKKANRSIKQALFKSIWAETEEDRIYWGKVCDERVEFFCSKFDITPKQLFRYF